MDCGKTSVDSIHVVHDSVSSRRSWVSVHVVHGKNFLCIDACVDADLHRKLFSRAERRWRRRSNVQLLDAFSDTGGGGRSNKYNKYNSAETEKHSAETEKYSAETEKHTRLATLPKTWRLEMNLAVAAVPKKTNTVPKTTKTVPKTTKSKCRKKCRNRWHFFRHFWFWRFRHPYKTLGPPLYLKSPRSLKNISVSALIFSVSAQIVSFSAPTVSVSAQKQKIIFQVI